MYLSMQNISMNDGNANLLDIIAHSPQGIAVYETADLKIRFVNQSMLTVWGMDDRIVGQNFADVFPAFTEQGFTDLLLNVWHSGVTYRATAYPADIIIDGKSETKYFDFEYQAIVDANGQTVAILHTSTDVTPRKRALQMIEEKEALISFNKDLETLTHTLSHDLRNPLGVAKMGTQFMRSKTNMPSAEVHKWCDAILASISSMESIINHTLRVNQVRIYESSTDYVNMPEIIDMVCTEVKSFLEIPHAIFRIKELHPLPGDKSLLQQLFFSLIGNAVRYSSNKDQPIIEINSELTDTHTVYHIKDNGIGIPEAELSQLFELFYRGSNAQDFQGTGVGLSLVNKIIKRLGGRIQISSTLDRGTTVSLQFPREKSNN